MKKIAIQGQEASYHHQAAQKFFGGDIEIVACQTFKDVFATLENGSSDKAIIAIENSLFGSINPVYDLLLRSKFKVVGEVYLRIEHCLIGLPNSKIEDLREVHSQAEALAQCEEFLDTKLTHVDRFEHHDTAGSVRDVKKWNDPTKAAIASERAAELYGLKVLAKNIETNHQNFTRFLVLSTDSPKVDQADKASLIMSTADSPGALYHALGVFAKADMNLSKLQSRPVVGKAWHYIFYVDVSFKDPKQLDKALADLAEQGCKTTCLGTYKSANKV